MDTENKTDEDFEKALKQSVAPKEGSSTRRKIFKMSLHEFTHIFKTGQELHYKVEKGFPEDARVVDLCPDIFNGNTISLLVESESFDEIEEGKPYPMDEEGIVITTQQ
jgi:hypothetical protein